MKDSFQTYHRCRCRHDTDAHHACGKVQYMAQKFLRCEKCGNIVGMVNDSGVTPMCCGQKMTVLEPNTTDAAVEKHVPEYKIEGDTVTVTVSSVEHPMAEEHYIMWISLQTNEGNQRRVLKPGDKPVAVFKLNGSEKVEAAYAYCNLHGLWKK